MQAVIFDMDGVLIDVSGSYRLTIKEVIYERTGVNINDELIQRYKNRGGVNDDWDLTDRILADMKLKAPKKDVAETFQKKYIGTNFTGNIKNEKLLIKKEILERINNKYKTAIVTGRPRKEALYTLNKFEIVEYFDLLIALEDIPSNKKKPHPYALNLALDRLGVIPQEAIYAGDCVDDMVAAARADIYPLGITTSDINPKIQGKILTERGAKTILDSINRIMEVLE